MIAFGESLDRRVDIASRFYLGRNVRALSNYGCWGLTICFVASFTGLVTYAVEFQSSGSRVPTLISLQLPFKADAYPPTGSSVFEESTITERRSARSLGYFAKGPAVSYFLLIGMIPSPGTIPRVGFTVYSEARVAGLTRDPNVSEPIAIGARPALVAIALPEEEPEGLLRSLSELCTNSVGRGRAYTVAGNTVLHVQASEYISRLRLSCHSRPSTSYISASGVIQVSAGKYTREIGIHT